MTKTLLILRHAKSSWKDTTLADHDRPLNKRGKRDAPRIGRLLRKENLVPDLIISSTARRAHDTVELVVKYSDCDGQVVWASSLYMGGYLAYLNSVRTVEDDVEMLMVVGHNPDLEGLVTALTGLEEAMPTAALARIELPVGRWSDVQEGSEYALINLWRPKEMDD